MNIESIRRTESQLTVNIMERVARQLDIDLTDDRICDIVWEATIFTTGDWPEDEGFGSSDSYGILNSVASTLSIDIASLP